MKVFVFPHHLACKLAILCGLSSGTLAYAQGTPCRQPNMQVGPFGGVTQAPPPLVVPKALAQFVPVGFKVRCVAEIKMSGKGETLLLLDDGEDIFPKAELHAIQEGKDHLLFSGTISAIAGLQTFQLADGKELLAFAHYEGGDQAVTIFDIFGARGGAYPSVFHRKTTEGQIRLLDGAPLKFELWSVNWSFDPPESCVWCPHRYAVRTYVWRKEGFVLVAERTTPEALSPGEIAHAPFTSAAK